MVCGTVPYPTRVLNRTTRRCLLTLCGATCLCPPFFLYVFLARRAFRRQRVQIEPGRAKARQGKARQGKARQGKARQTKPNQAKPSQVK